MLQQMFPPTSSVFLKGKNAAGKNPAANTHSQDNFSRKECSNKNFSERFWAERVDAGTALWILVGVVVVVVEPPSGDL